MIEQQIEQIIKTLAKQHKIKVEKHGEALSYSPSADTIYYNPEALEDSYNFLKNFARITLEDFITHDFGHELGHRKKHKAVENSLITHRVMMELYRRPERAIEILPQEQREIFPLLRASAIAYNIANEHYAVTNNPLYSPEIAKAELLCIIYGLREVHNEVRRALHGLVVLSADDIDSFIPVIIRAPLPHLKRYFPQEFSTLRKIRLFLQTIKTPQDCFNTNKMEKLGEIILYEL